MSGRCRDELASAAPLAVAAALPPLMGVERVGAPGGAAGAGGAEALNGAAAPPARADEPPRKRTKLSEEPLRQRVLEYKLLRLKTLRDRYTEQLSELYFLQAGGNMMDYAAWRKRPPTQLLAFLEARRPPPVAAPPPPPEPPPPPAPALPALPALPAPVAAPAPSAAPHCSAVAPAPPVATAAPPAPADEMVEKARQEAYVASRVAELARAGLWAERRLPRVCEPPRPKTHWDYLLEEMAWLAQDFAHERKWKKQAAKKCARAVQKYFQDKAVAAQKAEKAQELQLKRIAAFAAKEIKTFWLNVEKLVEWKRERRVERARKEALDEQLSFIVDRTERYSRQLAANLHAGTPDTPPSDDEFQPRGASDDDEETIAAAEREAQHDAAHHRDELDALRRESRLALPDLLPPGYPPAGAPSPPPSPTRRASSDYSADADSADDEDTIAEQEQAERAGDRADAAAEIDALQREADLDLEELKRRYAGAPPDNDPDAHSDPDTEPESDDGSESDSEPESSASEGSASERLSALVGSGAAEGAEGSETAEAAGGSEQRVEAAASLAATLQPTGTTLQSTTVGTPVPHLLRHSLREYQHVGLHWLATMHARGLNGILADEMGLGKTIQTIALLAHLALERQDWGPHLVVAPTSVVLNWEMEFKKWCPAFKILTYYGTIKERKLKRVGWTKPNSFHVCITSYKLAVQDHQSFRRKRWRYLVLDEAQNIKNFKSQRWQMLLNFHTDRRLLLTGTPLQNSLLELWSLMHFLMPDVFASHSEFREWFQPVAALAGEGGEGAGGALVRRLHEVLRPFLLRRLKADVERQMPRKYEHVLLCRLAKRQRCLYDDFMARAKTKESLASGNLLSVINVLMQLRKVCNHPDLFEPRPISSPLQLPALRLRVPARALLDAVAARRALAARLGGDLASLEGDDAGAFNAHRARHLAPPRRLVEELGPGAPPSPPRPPPARLRLHLRLVPRTPPAPAALPAAAPPPPRSGPPRAPPPAPPLPRGAADARLAARRRAVLRRLAHVNERRCWRLPLFGADLRTAVAAEPPAPPACLAPRDLTALLGDMHDVIDRFSVCWRACVSGSARLEAGAGAGASDWRGAAARAEQAAAGPARALLGALHACVVRQAVAFPHPRLLQFDCGKLQTLAPLLRRLKAGGHRVLIFTQMTRVLDVLEGFLSLHGHTYKRLDGATRVEMRQALVDRFNADPRIFAFILSTRSGGVGLNLTGADCVIFYDSDWNPTMDAQAQDRCHRIGQTRDVHVFRLVTQASVEENILRKAEEKRRLGTLAIDDGHFTTSYLRSANIKELFGTSVEGCAEVGGAGAELESALAAAEEEQDAAAARAARTEQAADLAEFDETQPLRDDERDQPHAEPELTALMKQLTPIEKYAMRMVESSEAGCEAERAALSAVRRTLGDWERARRRLRSASPPSPPARAASPPLTYSRRDAANKMWASFDRGLARGERMPVWSPPSPPTSDGDAELYSESWARALYRAGPAPDAALPALPRAPRPPRPAPPCARAARPPRAPPAPPSLFERAGPRPRPRPRAPPAPHRDAPAPDWAPAEDGALRRALRLQRLPPDAPAALAPNWDWAAELVADVARGFRAPRVCRERHERLAAPDDRLERADRPDRLDRLERLDRHERARRKQRKGGARRRGDEDSPRPPLARLDAMREAGERRRAARRRRPDDAPHHNPKHAQLLADHGLDYERPPTPMEVASRRADRIAKEKLKAAGAGPSTAPAPAASPAPAPAPSPAPAAAPGAPAPLPAPAPAPAPGQRVVVAAHAGGAGKAEAARRARAAQGPAAPAQLLYRQQTMAARHHLKILHHAGAQSTQSVVSSAGEAGGVAGGAALRTLQLQQLALQRGALPAGRLVARPPHTAHTAHTPHTHVVVAHLPANAVVSSAHGQLATHVAYSTHAVHSTHVTHTTHTTHAAPHDAPRPPTTDSH